MAKPVFKLRFLDTKSHDLSALCSLSALAVIPLNICVRDMVAQKHYFQKTLFTEKVVISLKWPR